MALPHASGSMPFIPWSSLRCSGFSCSQRSRMDCCCSRAASLHAAFFLLRFFWAERLTVSFTWSLPGVCLRPPLGPRRISPPSLLPAPLVLPSGHDELRGMDLSGLVNHHTLPPAFYHVHRSGSAALQGRERHGCEITCKIRGVRAYSVETRRRQGFRPIPRAEQPSWTLPVPLLTF